MTKYIKEVNFMSIILSSVGISTIISIIMTALGYWLNYRNTGRQLEKYKKKLETRDIARDKTDKLYNSINGVMVNFENGYSVTQYYAEMSDNLKNDFEVNDLYIPKSVKKKFGIVIEDLGNFAHALDEIESAKARRTGSDYSEQALEEKHLNKKLNKIRKKMGKDFLRLKKTIKRKFKMFN